MQENVAKIKAKIQELATHIKEQTSEETKGIKEEILENVNEMKATVEDRFQGVQGKLEDNLQDFWGDLEGKALKVQYKIQEKFSQSLVQKDEIIGKTADSLIEAINKAKTTLQSKQE